MSGYAYQVPETHWADLPLLAIDCEATGKDPFEDRIVQLAAVTIDGTQVTHSWSSIVNPCVDIPDEAVAVHKITTEQAKAEGIAPQDALETVAGMIWEHDDFHHHRAPVVGFNMRYDWPLLLAEAERHGVEFPVMAPVLDPYLLDRMCHRFRKGPRKLVNVAEHYGVQLDNAHDATADATAAGLVMRAILDEYPELREHTLAGIWLHQAHGHEQWRQGFEDYLRLNVDKEASIPPGWPVPVERSRS